MIGLSRMVSLSARGGISIENILDQLKSCGVCPSYAVRHATKKDTSLGSCCPVAVGNALKNMYNEMQERLRNCLPVIKELSNDVSEIKKSEFKKSDIGLIDESKYEECPECHRKGLYHSGGCDECIYCGYSRCS